MEREDKTRVIGMPEIVDKECPECKSPIMKKYGDDLFECMVCGYEIEGPKIKKERKFWSSLEK